MTWRLAEYAEIGRIGVGSTGTVVSARHTPTGMFVAIKFLSARSGRRTTPSEWFRGQMRLLADVDDANVASLYEYVEGPRGGAVIMELVDGMSLDQMIRRGPLEPPAALAIFKGCLRGLAAAHANGLLHRDFRPANVQVGRGGAIKIVDFAVVPPVDTMQPDSGTPLYQAPELWDREPADERTDIYAATATFFECLTGHAPYPTASTMAEMRELHESAPIPLDDVPEPLRDLVRRGLTKQPAKRPNNAAAFLKDIEQVSARRYGSDWERAGESALFKRLLSVPSPSPKSRRVKPPRPATTVVASMFATRLLAGVALAVVIIIGVVSGVTAARPRVNTVAAEAPGFAVVLPNGATSSPTAIPSLLVIPTPGVTLTAPPVRTAGPGGQVVGLPTLAPPPVTHTVTPAPPPTTASTPPTTNTTTTVPPANVTGAHLASFSYDGAAASFQITVTTDGTGPATVSVTVSDNGSDAVSHQYQESGDTTYGVNDSLPISISDCTDPTLTISVQGVGFDGTSVALPLAVVCPASPSTP